MVIGKAKKNDYFSNHSLATKWPFTIYHRPIEESLKESLQELLKKNKSPRILVFGAGPFHESHLFPEEATITLVDTDSRLVPTFERLAAQRKNLQFFFCQTIQDLEERVQGNFDFISAKEVIEHIVDIKPYMRFFSERLSEDGALWVSTPNYGEPVFPVVEMTFLELIARSQGFTRLGLHPNKYSRRRLKEELEEVGFKKFKVKTTPLRLAITCFASK